jgi:hypothetical protein
MGELTTRSEMSKQLMNGVGGVGAGIGLIIISALGAPVVLVGAGICAAIGIGLALSKTQKKAGMVMLGAGVVVGVAGLISALTGVLVPIAGIGLIGLGIFSLYKFFSNMKKRS